MQIALCIRPLSSPMLAATRRKQKINLSLLKNNKMALKLKSTGDSQDDTVVDEDHQPHEVKGLGPRTWKEGLRRGLMWVPTMVEMKFELILNNKNGILPICLMGITLILGKILQKKAYNEYLERCIAAGVCERK